MPTQQLFEFEIIELYMTKINSKKLEIFFPTPLFEAESSTVIFTGQTTAVTNL